MRTCLQLIAHQSVAQKRLLILASLLTCLSCEPLLSPPTLGDWTRGSSLDGAARMGAVCFVVGNRAYIGLGIDSDSNQLSDVWAYDPARNAWTQ